LQIADWLSSRNIQAVYHKYMHIFTNTQFKHSLCKVAFCSGL